MTIKTVIIQFQKNMHLKCYSNIKILFHCIYFLYLYNTIYMKKGHLSWISRQNDRHQGKILKLYKLFNDKEIHRIERRIDSFERIRAAPWKYSWDDMKEFYMLPKNKICW